MTLQENICARQFTTCPVKDEWVVPVTTLSWKQMFASWQHTCCKVSGIKGCDKHQQWFTWRKACKTKRVYAHTSISGLTTEVGTIKYNEDHWFQLNATVTCERNERTSKIGFVLRLIPEAEATFELPFCSCPGPNENAQWLLVRATQHPSNLGHLLPRETAIPPSLSLSLSAWHLRACESSDVGDEPSYSDLTKTSTLKS